MSVVTGSSIVTFTGKVIDPLNPDPEQICIEDIAHSLSNQCRFTGHTKKFYSTAQHSVHVSEMCNDYKLWGLLHDASEAYLSDIARPVKHQLNGLGEIYRKAENELMVAVAERFGLFRFTYRGEGMIVNPLDVDKADNMMLYAEAYWLMPGVFPFPDSDIWVGQEIKPWAPDVAEIKFQERYEAIK